MINTNQIVYNALFAASVEPIFSRIRGDMFVFAICFPTFGTVTVEPEEDEDASELLPEEHSVPPTIPVVPEEEEGVSSGRREK